MKILTRTTILFTFMTLLTAANLFGQQASYSGTIGNAPVTLVTDIYSDGAGTAVYVYDKFDEPIRLEDGKMVENKLMLLEKGANKMTRATLTFNNYDAKAAELYGVWKDAKTGKTLDIKLKKDLAADDSSAQGEFIQGDSLPDKYFKVTIKGDRAEAVKIFEKKTDRLIQTIEVDTDQRGADSITVGDFNFDGIKDFSIFESSAAGPNTTSIYFLYDSSKKEFFDSEWSGTSLEFDGKTKTVISTNSCCAGRNVTRVVSRVVKNKLVTVTETCLMYDERKDTLVKRPMKQCQE